MNTITAEEVKARAARGQTTTFYVCCNPAAKSYDDETVVWKIEASGHPTKADDIGRITYGVVPAGFQQVVPADGHTPPALVANQRYEFLVRGYFTIAKGAFEIRDGKLNAL